MLVKEYRILLPLNVDEYRIAQLYMIQKKSRVDTSGAGSGVEIIQNEPYNDGPGGSGQYTNKIYHIGSHLPSQAFPSLAWIRSFMPTLALEAHEEAWNAYPYTKTRYSCPFLDRFFIEVETRYYNDGGCQQNVFNLSDKELKERQVDFMDFVKDPLPGGDYCKEEDPKLFTSQRTGRGPLLDNWASEHLKNGKPIMCAYKLCRVEFKYWGWQTRMEKWIHELALRRTMLRAHRQAWAWQDEWYGLTIEDIRRLEEETKQHLSQVMAAALREQEEGDDEDDVASDTGTVTHVAGDGSNMQQLQPPIGNGLSTSITALTEHRARLRSGGSDIKRQRGLNAQSASPSGSQRSVNSALRERFEGIRSDSEDSDSVYFDCMDLPHSKTNQLIRWSSDLAFGGADEESPPPSPRPGTCRISLLVLVVHGGNPFDVSYNPREEHGTNPVDDRLSKLSDVQTFRSTIDHVIALTYPHLAGRVSVQLVACPNVVSEPLRTLALLSPHGNDLQQALSEGCCHPALVSVIAAGSESFDQAVALTIARANQAYGKFLDTDEGRGFNGDVFIVGDSIGGLLMYDALVRSRESTLSRQPSTVSNHSDMGTTAIPEEDDSLVDDDADGIDTSSTRKERSVSTDNRSPGPSSLSNRPASVRSARHLSTPPIASGGQLGRRLHSTSDLESGAGAQMRDIYLNFKVSQLFLCGAPLSLLLVQRRLSQYHLTGELGLKDPPPPHPCVSHVFNLYYPLDPCACRLEPLLCRLFAHVQPITMPRYQRFPLGDGQPSTLVECLQRHEGELGNVISNAENRPSFSATLASVGRRWWGTKRVDYALYCPEGLSSFPVAALPNILHASYWENNDVVSFMLRQFVTGDDFSVSTTTTVSFTSGPNTSQFNPSQPTERWKRKRTSFKIKNAHANHRANDVIVLEGAAQVLTARFSYGPLDVVTLSGEKVDIYVSNADLSSSGDWQLYGTEITDSHGRLTFQIPQDKSLSVGVHPVKMVVRGDHTYMNMFLAVIPPDTECVVFSIDGSFTASVSVSGKDPKVRPGAVDVVRHWQDLGYLVLYITARPDMQQRFVSSWLAQHNFPHGLLFFTGSLSTDPLRQKTQYLKHLVDSGVKISAAYGSTKDVQVYKEVGVDTAKTFIVCRKKLVQHNHCVIDSYSAHLLQLTSGTLQTISRPVTGNPRLILRKGFFSIPGQYKTSSAGPLSVQRSHSFTPRSGKYNTQASQTTQLSAPVGDSLTVSTSSAGSQQSKSRGYSPFRLGKK